MKISNILGIILAGIIIFQTIIISNQSTQLQQIQTWITELNQTTNQQYSNVENQLLKINQTINQTTNNITDIYFQLHIINNTTENNKHKIHEIYLIEQDQDQKIENLSYMNSVIFQKIIQLSNNITYLNQTIQQNINPPYNQSEIYDSGVIITAPTFFMAVSKSPLISYNVVFSISDEIRVAPDIKKKDEILQVINWTKIPYSQYLTEFHDCDDYAYALYAIIKQHYPMLAFGVMHSQTHAYNYIIFANTEKYYYEIYFIEPQKGIYLDPSKLPLDSPYFPITFILF